MVGRRKKLHLSKLYPFACGRSSFEDGHSLIGRPGYSHVVRVNSDMDLRGSTSNYVSTTKYNLLTFVPKSIFEQFRRVANVYFLVSAILSFTTIAPQSKISAVLPITVVIFATMVKEAVEDWRRYQQDEEVNNRKVKVLNRNDETFQYTEWKNLKVGNIVKVEKDHYFPADLLLLSSSYEDGICYVETMNLDGETNLKVKQSLEVTSELQEESSFANLGGVIRCEDPNANLYTFVGTMDCGGENQHPLSPQQLLLRDSKLRNTDHIYGAVVFTGHDTKVMQNTTGPPSKRSNIEKKMDKLIYLMLFLLVLISLVGSIFFGITTRDDLKNGKMKRWYLRPDDAGSSYDPKRPELAGFLHFLTAMILFGYFIPISLYISMEIVKILQVIFINQDIQMYYEEANKPAHARTSNLNEELGQVHTILSDKTGTLTCNSMEFIKCSIAGTAYGRGFTEVERAVAKRRGTPLHRYGIEEEDGSDDSRNHDKIKGYNFKDERLTNGKWVKESNEGLIRMFFRLLAICHTAIPDVDENSGKISYEAESPDEAAFVVAARELGFEFCQRTQTSILLRELDGVTGERIERSYTLLNVLEFNSTRKRMSVIVRDEEGKLMILSKGADSVMFQLLAEDGRTFEEETREHVDEYADAGLRTLVLAYRELEEEEYDNFRKVFLEAKATVGADRDEKIDAAAEMVEKNLMLLGATAVEDKLQEGVPDCIDKLAQAEIKIWVLTGDKMETAINIGFACSLLRQEMQQIIVTLDAPDIVALEKAGNKELITKESKASVIHQLTRGRELVDSSNTDPSALIIDGKSLAFALEDDVKDMFLALATQCASVICCRSSPKQKALVTRLVKNGTRKTTLAIGDGANDVGMLQEADIGVGISGFEGMQAVMASDIAIGQFRFLERLLLVHGHWCYRRITSMICYFFYKNITFGLTLFLYEAYTSFSGQPAYNDWILSLYNVFFTSLPAIALGVFDQDVSPKYCVKFPLLYQEGVQNILFSWTRIIGWMFNGVLNAITIFFFCMAAVELQAFREGGQVASQDIFGVLMCTCVIWVVNCQMALFVRFFTLMQHIFIWGGMALWYLFLLAYGAITPKLSTNAYMVFIEAAAPAPSYWITTLFIVIATLIPYFSYSAIQIQFFPMYHEQIQWWRMQGKGDDPEYCEMVRQQSVRRNTVGFSARIEAKLKKLKNRIHDTPHHRTSI